MLINYVACRTNSCSPCNNLVAAMEKRRYLTLECLNGGLDGRDGEGLTWGRWLRLWQRWWPVAKQDEWRRRKTARGEGPVVVVVVLPLVRIWVRREAALPSVSGGERYLWGLQGLKTQWREKEGRKMLVGNWGMTGFWPSLDPIFSLPRPWNAPFL